ncbi:Sec-independent protein translocase protein TatA/E homolog [Gordonia hirsuta DSM 44140 = NBRC 16056]|uniref:Sec-independent protein translocase protein TatA n=1 Tax=Gordonia hirsuta DSM 44140 = NBRC 16056 TaxID=1121927 RepID=L7L597_9ACTN|nr:Sec-independent protein translocase subunit TatA [Gordonia hirsuta]GAC56104.1 Sec-independent protein translocase protein TatA/E homolog [Gordonia hirsuta DSM 44140 = NBRC 16056]
MNIGAAEIAILVIVLILLFGAKKLPDMARGLGRSMRIFKSEINEMKSDGKTDEQPAAEPRELPSATEKQVDGVVTEVDDKKSA